MMMTTAASAATAAVILAGLLGAAPTGAADSLSTLVQQDVDAVAPGVVVRVDDGRHRPVTVAKQAAWTRADHRLSAGDQFRMGSNTKTMVATVALRLVAERRLKLNDPVERWLPGAVANGRTITVRMLLNHTSGLPDYFSDLEAGRFDPDVLDAVTGKVQRDWTPRQLLAVAARGGTVEHAMDAQRLSAALMEIEDGLVLDAFETRCSRP